MNLARTPNPARRIAIVETVFVKIAKPMQVAQRTALKQRVIEMVFASNLRIIRAALTAQDISAGTQFASLVRM